ncbi:MAG: hypothetical protein AAGE01_04510 [Pseudomonadota bacterium]
MHAFRVLAVFAATLLMAFSASADDEAYRVETRLLESDRQFAQAVLIVAPNTRATMAGGGDDFYTLDVVVTPLDDGNLKVEFVLDSAHGAMTPTVIAEPYKPVSVSTGGLALKMVARPVQS